MSDLATGIAAYGTLLQYKRRTGSPLFYRTIAGVGDIDGPGSSRNVLDKTTHSTGGNRRAKVAGLIDSGELSFPVFYDPEHPTHDELTGLGAIYESGETVDWRIHTRKDDGAYVIREFEGFVSTFGESYPIDGIQTRDTTVVISGALTTVTP